MKALNQYTFAGTASVTFLAIASYYLKAATIGAAALSFITVGVFSSALVLFLAAQLAYSFFYPETQRSSSANKTDTSPTPVPTNTLSTEAQAVIRIDMNKICQTSGWYNNCGLNCMTHFMFTKLSAIPSKQFTRFLKENPEYDSFLSTFQTYYGLQQKPNWSVVLTLLTDHTRSDREAIFAPVLRSHIGKIMPTFPKDFLDTKFVTALSDYVQTGEVTDVANAVYASNKDFFKEYKAEFDVALEKAKAVKPTRAESAKANKNLQAKQKNKDFPDFVITEVGILDIIQLQRKLKLEDEMLPKAKAYWMSRGCKAYAGYVADLKKAEMISADQLQWLGERFNIGVEVYTPASMDRAIEDPILGESNHGMQCMPEGHFKWTMRVHNSGMHWTFEEANERQAATDDHNSHFYSDDNKSSQYKKLGSPQSIEMIKKAIQEIMNPIKLLTSTFSSSAKKAAKPVATVGKATAKNKRKKAVH